MNKPLVSIIVITYNSSKYVLETLESAKAQTYQNIELIISDDGSQDQTLELCERWLADNKERFVNSQIITVEKNTGIPANCNRGVKASKGEWIKLIAGDDILLSNCIQDNVKKIMNTTIKVLFSKIQLFADQHETRSLNQIIPDNIDFFNCDSMEQFQLLLDHDQIGNTPSSFINKKIVEELEYFDEEFKLIEDYPFWLKCTLSGHKLNFLDELTVLYRLHSSSISLSESLKDHLVDPVNYRNELLREKYIYPHYSRFGKLRHRYAYFIKKRFIGKASNKPNHLFYLILSKYLNPFVYVYSFCRRFSNTNIDLKKIKN